MKAEGGDSDVNLGLHEETHQLKLLQVIIIKMRDLDQEADPLKVL